MALNKDFYIKFDYIAKYGIFNSLGGCAMGT